MSITIQTITNLTAAQQYWQLLVPQHSFYDHWQVRLAFWRPDQSPISFRVAFDQEKPVGLLALQWNEIHHRWEFFGGYFFESNQVYHSPGYELVIPLLYKTLSQQFFLEDINDQTQYFNDFQFHDHKYVLDVSTFLTLSDYIQHKIPANRRRNFRKIINEFPLNHQIKHLNQSHHSLDGLIKLNKEQFGDKSVFYKPQRSEIIHQLLDIPEVKLVCHSWEIDNQIQGHDLACLYGDTYSLLFNVVKKLEVPNLGNYSLLYHINQAIQNKYQAIDFGMENYGWKERWHLQALPQFNFTNL